MKSIKKYKIGEIIISAIAIVLGLVMIIWPEISAVIVCYLAGIVCIAMGVYEIDRYYHLGFVGVLFRHDLLLGMSSILFGVLLLLHPQGALTILPIVLGIYIIIVGIDAIQTSIETKRFGMSYWWKNFLLGCLGMVMGLIMVLNPFAGNNMLFIFIGISLIITGIEKIYLICCISNAFHCNAHEKIIDAEWHEIE